LKDYSLLLLVFFVWTIAGCNRPVPSPIPVDEIVPSVDTLVLSGQKVVVHQGEKGLPKTIYLLDEKGQQTGYAVQYGQNGGLSSISHWEKGLKEGNSFVLEEAQKTHRLFERGKLVYEADYHKQSKIDNRLYPNIIEEFLFEDKYYTKVKFPLPYAGHLAITVQDYQFVVTPLPEQTFQLVINDALDLTEYNLELTYQPAARDTLLAAKYRYKHVVYGGLN
jgi:hypothetical protein